MREVTRFPDGPCQTPAGQAIEGFLTSIQNWKNQLICGYAKDCRSKWVSLTTFNVMLIAKP